MPHFAAAVVRGAEDWTASEVDVTGAADIEEVAEALRDVSPDAELSLLFVESDDTYLVILRLDAGEDLRVFGSDARFAGESRMGALLLGDIEAPVLELDPVLTAPADTPVVPQREGSSAGRSGPSDDGTDPVGDADILADLGVPAARLLALCASDGLLPADVTAEACQVIGCGDEVEELREP